MNYSYKIGCNPDNLKGVRDFIRKTLEKYRVNELEISEVVLALDEMCSNLIIHSHHCNPQDLFELNILIEKDTPVIFELVDDGSLFDINKFTEPSIDRIVHQKRKGGLGIRLVKSIMDKVEYKVNEGKTICRLTKNVSFKEDK